MKSQQKTNKIEIQSYRNCRPKPLNSFPQTLTLSINSKEDLRDIITDFILHNMGINQQNNINLHYDKKSGKENSQKATMVPLKKQKNKLLITYPKIPLNVTINRSPKIIDINLLTLLNTYIKLSSKFHSQASVNESRIEPMIVDILDFIDRIQEEVKGINYELSHQLKNDSTPHKMMKSSRLNNLDNEGSAEKITDERIIEEVLSMIIERHMKQKNKVHFSYEDNHISKDITAKHMRISFVDLNDRLKRKQKQFTLQIKNGGKFKESLTKNMGSDHYTIIPNKISDISDRLRDLLDSGDFLNKTEELRKLKKEALMRFYDSDQSDYLRKKSHIQMEIQSNFLVPCKETGFKSNKEPKYQFEQDNHSGQEWRSSKSNNQSNQQYLNSLKEWLVDIQLSEQYYESKFLHDKRYMRSKIRK